MAVRVGLVTHVLMRFIRLWDSLVKRGLSVKIGFIGKMFYYAILVVFRVKHN